MKVKNQNVPLTHSTSHHLTKSTYLLWMKNNTHHSQRGLLRVRGPPRQTWGAAAWLACDGTCCCCCAARCRCFLQIHQLLLRASGWKKMFANSLVVKKKKKMTEISWCCCCRVDCACRYIIMIVNNASRWMVPCEREQIGQSPANSTLDMVMRDGLRN